MPNTGGRGIAGSLSGVNSPNSTVIPFAVESAEPRLAKRRVPQGDEVRFGEHPNFMPIAQIGHDVEARLHAVVGIPFVDEECWAHFPYVARAYLKDFPPHLRSAIDDGIQDGRLFLDFC